MSLALCLLVTPFVVWAIARLAGLDRAFPWIQLMAFTPYVALLSVVPVAVALATRHWWIGGVAILAALTLAACVLPRGLPGSLHTRVSREGPAVRFLTSNMLEGGADAVELVGLVREQRVDLLALQEVTPASVQSLAAAGLWDLLPYRKLLAHDGVSGSALFSRYPLKNDGERVNPGGFLQARATVSVPGALAVEVESVHPVSPGSAAGTPNLVAGLAGQPPANHGGPVRVLLGDFNATLDHWALRRLLATGYRDAAAVVGVGLTPTWSYYGPHSRLTPKITLDHVLADSRVGVTRVAVFGVPRTDHRAVLAELIIPAP